MKKYITVPAPVDVATEGTSAQHTADTISKMINYYAGSGWTYHSMETLGGGKGSRFEKKPQTAPSYMLIFERDEE